MLNIQRGWEGDVGERGNKKNGCIFSPPRPGGKKQQNRMRNTHKEEGGGKRPVFLFFFFAPFPNSCPLADTCWENLPLNLTCLTADGRVKLDKGEAKQKENLNERLQWQKKIHGYSTYKEDGGGKAPEKRKSGAFLALHPFCMFRTKYYGVVRSTYLYCGKPQRSIICIPVVCIARFEPQALDS